MEQHGSKWTNVHDIRYFSIFKKSVEQFQVSLKYDKNKGDKFRFFENISLSYS
jgi:hypothetical protein